MTIKKINITGASTNGTLRTELIRCPKCEKVQLAAVTFGQDDLWPSFVHHCVGCGYTIMESEWETVEKPPVTPVMTVTFVTYPSGRFAQKYARGENIPFATPDNCHLIAEGDALEWIINNITGIPLPKTDCTTFCWIGDFARTIAAAWKYMD